jgi:hypothetical protein
MAAAGFAAAMQHLDLNALLAGHPEPTLRRATLHAMAVSDRARHIESIRSLGKDIATPLRDFATRNRVGPIVALALEEAFPGGYPHRDSWRELYAREDRRMAVLLDRLDAIAGRLARDGIAMVALKNAGIARGVYPHRGACPMGDLDVLVSRGRFEAAHALIVEEGFRLDTRGTVESADLAEGLAHGGTEYVGTFGGEEVWFELQWRPIAGRWLRPDQEPSGDELLARSVPIAGSDVRLLSPEDNMLQVALHTAKHTYVRAPGLRLHTDVDRLATFAAPDWDLVVQRLRALETTTAAYFSFALAEALLGSPVPDATLDALAPPLWKRRTLAAWLTRVDLFEPEQKKFNRAEMMGFTALLYDDGVGLLASALGSRRDELRLGAAPELAVRGVRRLRDIVTRYQG